MATEKTVPKPPVAVVLPEGSLLVGTQEHDGRITETRAFRVVQGVVVIETTTENGTLKSVAVKYHNSATLITETIHGTQTTGTLVGAGE